MFSKIKKFFGLEKDELKDVVKENFHYNKSDESQKNESDEEVDIMLEEDAFVNSDVKDTDIYWHGSSEVEIVIEQDDQVELNWGSNILQIVENIEFDKKHTYLGLGDVQSGKTNLLISVSYKSIKNNISCLVIVPKYIANENQFKDRWISKYKEYLDKYGLNDIPSEVISLLPPTQSSVKINVQIDEALTVDNKPQIIICVCNIKRLKHLVEILDNSKRSARFNMWIDEVDYLYKSNAQFKPYFDKLRSLANTVVGVSGTIFDVALLKDKFFTCNTRFFKTDIPGNYKGLYHKDVHFKEIQNIDEEDDEDSEVEIIFEDLEKKEEYEFEKKFSYLNDLLQHPGFQTEGNYHPVISLHKDTRSVKIHAKYQLFCKEHCKTITTIVYNGNGISLYSPKFYSIDEITLPDGYKAYKNDKGIFTFKNIGINKILECVRILNKEVRHIIIFSGCLADRGISFVSEYYHWHLTHEYLGIKVTNPSTTLQALRLWGCYNDNIPLTLMTSSKIYEQCMKAYEIQQKFYTDCKGFMEEMSINECIEKSQYEANIVPKGLKKKTYITLNIVKMDFSSAPDGTLLLITPDNKNSMFDKYYYRIVNYMEECTGNWYSRSEIFTKVCKDNKEKVLMDGRVVPHKIFTKNLIEDENTPGLLMKKVGDIWKLRYNVE